ncbi:MULTISPECIES: class I SAM-dependent methyltransferase [unclassified Micromonospora]|uniref:N5-glutamine methyltransferase family protein n=1 Tax=unclassified Micromonospora TaxID=2617518 RepID=UPI001C5E3DB9|nr:class I SAM-dependent methyltransferase [Micromonospora sp. RL09-050-HVF-A]MBW4702640.1 class I SAM-dependent methyltransferase [Micromonospora sp. RL09-050-HVF-A]
MAEVPPTGTDVPPVGGPDGDTYEAEFGCGHHFRLFDRPGTFHVSRAGIALGDYLVRSLRGRDITGRILEIGTGSGAIALLLRHLGATSVTATDISASAVATARQNELANFGVPTIDFWHSDLFPPAVDGEPALFDLIVFNPPGWRTPSDNLIAELDEKHHSLGLEAMFYGDSVLLRFLQQLPDHLTANGRAIIGLNSLIGIADIFTRSRSTHPPQDGSVIRSRLLERIEIPLLFYTDEWLQVKNSLLAQFEKGRQEYAASYVTKGDTIHWFYEITEVTVQGQPTAPVLPGRENTRQPAGRAVRDLPGGNPCLLPYAGGPAQLAPVARHSGEPEPLVS